VVITAIAVSGAAWPASATASLLPVQTSKGTVNLTIGSTDSGDTTVYTVQFTGPITDHGWSHTGTLTAIGSTWRWTASMANLPFLSVSTGDGKISGTCAGASQAASVDETVAGDGPLLDVDFGCVLSRLGGTPWEITLHTLIKQGLAGGSTWTGTYVEDDVASPGADPSGSATFGQVQLGTYTSEGTPQYGPLRFSGQIDIGGTLYRGDLVSGVSDYVRSIDIPPLAVSGSSNGLDVSGTCSGLYDETVAQADVQSYEFTCSLAVGQAAPVTVSLKSVFDRGVGACAFRDCWGDSEGYYVGG
jgi:hypothetical protein